LGDYPQSLKILMFDSVQVLWRKGEKEFAKFEKILNFNANKQLELKKLKWRRTFCIMDQQVYFNGKLKQIWVV